MIIETYTCIEVENVPDIWAVDLFECNQEMKPVSVNFIAVNNSYNENKFDYVDLVIMDSKPEKIIDGINCGISDDYKEVGFWRIKNKVC